MKKISLANLKNLKNRITKLACGHTAKGIVRITAVTENGIVYQWNGTPIKHSYEGRNGVKAVHYLIGSGKVI